MAFVEDFDGTELDREIWLPHYLPMWSSRARTAASYRLEDSCLVLDVPPGHGVWLPGEHDPPLRVSGVQTGNRSGLVGSTAGQQAVYAGQVVREEQPEFTGHLVSGGHLEIRCRMTLSPRSMAALWLSGFERRPNECGELCVVEVFGKEVVPGESAAVGVGIKQIRDPDLVRDFTAPRLPIDVAELHTYAVDWDATEAAFSVNGVEVKRCAGPPTYELQLMLAVFDFPTWSDGADDDLVPELLVDRISSD
ncbi:MAG TPA: glycoside hydrolase family 16 protein [Marmoricola sp.]|nr:glycoside hydrolase family 16 protein [Marmoricola sp.]